MLKTLEFLNSRRPDLEIRGTFIQQLQQFEQRLCNRGLGPLSFNFNDLSFKGGKGFQKDLDSTTDGNKSMKPKNSNRNKETDDKEKNRKDA